MPFTSVTKYARGKAEKTALCYTVATIFVAFFGAVYEYFSFGVFSNAMIYAFAFPLLGGVLPYTFLAARQASWHPAPWAKLLWHCGIATFTIASILQGIIEIYGTTNRLISYLFWIGGGMLLAGMVCQLLSGKKN